MLPLPVALDHRQFAELDPFKGGEASVADRAEAPSADRRIILGRSRVLDLGVIVTAERTAHHISLWIVEPPDGEYALSGMVSQWRNYG